MDARRKFGEHERSVRVVRGAARQTRPRNISRPNLYSKNCKSSAQKQNTNKFLACTRPCSRFSMLESLFTRIREFNT